MKFPRLCMKRENEEDVLVNFPTARNYKSKNHRPFIRIKKGKNFYTFVNVIKANKNEYDKDSELPLVYMDTKTGKKLRLEQS